MAPRRSGLLTTDHGAAVIGTAAGRALLGRHAVDFMASIHPVCGPRTARQPSDRHVPNGDLAIGSRVLEVIMKTLAS